jgi:hypothetical protein
MTHNIGTADRIIRIILGVFLLSLTLWGPQTLWGLIGIIPIATGFLRSCPLYTALHVTTETTTVKTGKLKL